MSTQKIFGLLVTGQNVPLIEKPDENAQCYLCGFRYKSEDCMVILVNKDLNDKRRVHIKCIENHLKLLPAEIKIALVNVDTNEVVSYYTTVSGKA